MKYELPLRPAVREPLTREIFLKAEQQYLCKTGQAPIFCLLHPATAVELEKELSKFAEECYSVIRNNAIKSYNTITFVRSLDIDKGEFHLCGN